MNFEAGVVMGMGDYYLQTAVEYVKTNYGIHLDLKSNTLPQQVFLLKTKLNCPTLNGMWDEFQHEKEPEWMDDV